MPTEELYDIAMRYKKTKLWKQLFDTELFAVRLSCGETGYCCVMGELGEHIALAVYVGRAGLDSYRNLGEAAKKTSEMKQFEQMVSQDCVQCSFENKVELSPGEAQEARRYAKAHGITYHGRNSFPKFTRYRPSCYPWKLKEKADQQNLYEALSAAIQVSQKLQTEEKEALGFQKGALYNRTIPLLEKDGPDYKWSAVALPAKEKKIYPSPVIRDELLLARLKRKKQQGFVWACELVMLPDAVSDEDGAEEGEEPQKAPVFPYLMLIVNCRTGLVIPSQPVERYAGHAEKFITALADSMLVSGVPSEIQVRDRRTEALLRRFAGQTGIRVQVNKNLSLLDRAEEDLLNCFSADEDPGQAEDDYQQFLDMLMQMDSETFHMLPQNIKNRLLQMEQRGDLPEPVSEHIRKLLK